MKSCPDEGLKLDYVNSRLGTGKRKEFERYLAHCPECRLEIEKIQSLIDAFKTVLVPEPPEDLAASTKGELRQTIRADAKEQERAIPGRESKGGQRLRQVLTFAAGFIVFAALLIALLPVHITTSGLGGLFKTPSAPRLSQASAEFLTSVLDTLPFLLVPSIIVNAGLLLRRKRRRYDRTIHPSKA